MNLLLYDRVLKKKRTLRHFERFKLEWKSGIEHFWTTLSFVAVWERARRTNQVLWYCRATAFAFWLVRVLVISSFVLPELLVYRCAMVLPVIFDVYLTLSSIQNMIRICGCPSLLMTSFLILRKCEGAKFVGWSLYTLSVNFKDIFLLDTAVGRVFITFVTHADKISFNDLY